MSDIWDRLDRESEPWKPEPGDKLVGVITSIEERVSDYGPYKTVTLDTGEALKVVHCFGAVLENALERKRPRVGDVMGVKFLGEKVARDGKTRYADYRVEVDPKSPRAWDEPPPSEPPRGYGVEDDGPPPWVGGGDFGPDEAPF